MSTVYVRVPYTPEVWRDSQRGPRQAILLAQWIRKFDHGGLQGLKPTLDGLSDQISRFGATEPALSFSLDTDSHVAESWDLSRAPGDQSRTNRILE